MEHLNSFDDAQRECQVLSNARRQYSLWPAGYPLPAGWQPVFGPQPRAACDSWLAQHWQEPTQIGSHHHV